MLDLRIVHLAQMLVPDILTNIAIDKNTNDIEGCQSKENKHIYRMAIALLNMVKQLVNVMLY